MNRSVFYSIALANAIHTMSELAVTAMKGQSQIITYIFWSSKIYSNPKIEDYANISVYINSENCLDSSL